MRGLVVALELVPAAPPGTLGEAERDGPGAFSRLCPSLTENRKRLRLVEQGAWGGILGGHVGSDSIQRIFIFSLHPLREPTRPPLDASSSSLLSLQVLEGP